MYILQNYIRQDLDQDPLANVASKYCLHIGITDSSRNNLMRKQPIMCGNGRTDGQKEAKI